jgi:hypothetical protein
MALEVALFFFYSRLVGKAVQTQGIKILVGQNYLFYNMKHMSSAWIRRRNIYKDGQSLDFIGVQCHLKNQCTLSHLSLYCSIKLVRYACREHIFHWQGHTPGMSVWTLYARADTATC